MHHLILVTTLSTHCYYSHFTDKEVEAMLLPQGISQLVVKSQKVNLVLYLPDPRSLLPTCFQLPAWWWGQKYSPSSFRENRPSHLRGQGRSPLLLCLSNISWFYLFSPLLEVIAGNCYTKY